MARPPIRRLSLTGTPAEMGYQFGEALRPQIERLYAARIKNALAQAKEYGGRTIGVEDLLAISRRCLPFVGEYSPRGYEELDGIGRGSELGLLKIWTMNALTDLRDVAAYGDPSLFRPIPGPDGEGCSSFLLPGPQSQDGRAYAGQTWDLATDNLPHVLLVERTPKGRPRTVALTTDGCLSLIGQNEAGIAIGTTNLRTTDARAGVAYLDVIHRALEEEHLDAAVSAVEGAPRAGAHYYYLLDHLGAGAGIECAATVHSTVPLANTPYVHCNHVLEACNLPLEAQGTPVASTTARQRRLPELLSHPGRAVADLQAALADHHGGNNAICRHDFGGITSNGAMILGPGVGKVWAVHGPACEGTWIEVPIGKLP